MDDAGTRVERLLLPWLETNHPRAGIVFLAGSYGRALGEGGYRPVASSDVDVVVVYPDLAAAGFPAAMQIACVERTEEWGLGAGELTIDANVHDLASLHYHDAVVRGHSRFAHLHFMLAEAHVLVDRLGIAPVLQDNARRLLEEGPAPQPRGEWEAEGARLESYLRALEETDTGDERRILGALAFFHARDYVFGIHGYWRCPKAANQAYRVLAEHFPDDHARMEEGFSLLLRAGETGPAEVYLAEVLERGRALAEHLPAVAAPVLHPPDRHLTEAEAAGMRDTFHKFMAAHVCEALETSRARGELAYLENLAVTLFYAKTILECREGAAPVDGREAFRYLDARIPSAAPALAAALDDGDHGPLHRMIDDVLGPLGGVGFRRIRNFYPHDAARVRAAAGVEGVPAFRVGYDP